MADIDNSFQPVGTLNPGDVAAKIVDSTNPALGLKVNADGSLNTTISATDLDIRDLAFATDKVDASGSQVSLDAATLAALENVTVSATDLDIRDLSAASDSVSAHLKDEAGNAFSSANPLPIEVIEAANTKVHSFNQASVIKDATNNHDYTVTAGKTLLLSSVFATSAARLKIEVQVETGVGTNVFTTKFVGFNSVSNPNIEFKLNDPIAVAAGVKVRVARTNRDGTTDLYSTIVGREV